MKTILISFFKNNYKFIIIVFAISLFLIQDYNKHNIKDKSSVHNKEYYSASKDSLELHKTQEKQAVEKLERYLKYQKHKTDSISIAKNITITDSTFLNTYQLALRTFDKRDYVESKKAFFVLATMTDNDSLKSKCIYWYGESLYAVANYSESIAAFRLIVNKFHGSVKHDDAYIKLGISYLRLQRIFMAKDVFEEFILACPQSEYISRAKKYLNEIAM